MIDQRFSDNDVSRRDIPSFIEPRPPLISNPFMRPRPQKGTNLLELFEEDSDCEEPELVQVYLRLKPCNIPSNLYEVKSDRCLITSLDTATVGHGRRTQHNVSKMYTFSHIFGPEANQKELFERIVKDNLKKLPEGHSFTLLTYGASGSGKTFTLMGTVAAPGLVPRSLEYVFRVVDAAQKPVYKPADNGAEKLSHAAQENELQFVKQIRHLSAPLRDKYRRMSVQLNNDLTSSNLDLSNRTKYYVWVSFVEIYNEGIYDLLTNNDRSASSKLVIREDANGNVYVKGATQVFVRTGEEAYDVMVAGKHNLQVAATGVNAHSSRSHCIFTITMLTETDMGCRVASVRLCDLAGCERARRTRNAGARLAESRAINSSLHVLERCLRTLRRRQKAQSDCLVPYRESKLTRLLGAGLSGARGEAVCVVVTLNPAPDCAHETRHVLQLAAVARDIQVNSTASEFSALESSSHDSTITSNEVLKLRAENERLHFELLQAQAHNRSLSAAMEERQAESAATMRELVDEAKDMTRQYYEALLRAARDEMEEMKEEYEARLSKVPPQPTPRENTPSRLLQNKVSQLMREIAILEEKLTAEVLARARAEEELQHLRVCIEERDEKVYKDSQKAVVMSLTDSEDESDPEDSEDPCNESLEPTFRREEINRSRLMRQSLAEAPQKDETDESLSEGNQTAEKINDTLNERSDDTLLDKSEDDIVDNEEGMISTDDVNKTDDGFEEQSEFATDFSSGETVISSSDAIEEKCASKMLRGTYFVRRSQDDSNTDSNAGSDNSNLDGTKNNRQSQDRKEEIKLKDESNISELKEDSLPDIDNSNVRGLQENLDVEIRRPLDVSQTFVNKIIKSLKSTSQAHNSDASLAQFEQLEIAANEVDSETRRKTTDSLLGSKKYIETKTYFDDNGPNTNSTVNESVKGKKVYFDNLDTVVESVKNNRISDIKSMVKKCDEFRSPSIVKEDTETNYEPSTMKLFGESFTKQTDPISVLNTTGLLKKKQDSVDVFDYDSPRTEILATGKHESNIRQGSLKIDPSDVQVLSDKFDNVLISNAESSEVKSSEHVKVSGTKDEKINIITEQTIDTIHLEEKTKMLDISNTSTTKCEENEKVKICKPVLDQSHLKVGQTNNDNILDDKSKNDVDTFVKPLPKEAEKVKVSETKTDSARPKVKPTDVNDKSNNLANSTNHNKSEIIEKSSDISNCTGIDNTLEEFENIYKEISVARPTEFELLVSQTIDTSNNTETALQQTMDTSNNTETAPQETETKYNLRKKALKKFDAEEIDENYVIEVLKESQSKCESVAKSKRNLRLRRRKQETENAESNKVVKLKDIANLQTEFSDVTLDVPAPCKEVKDIASPPKPAEVENQPPGQEIQSCPSKSVTRSRRKLFTPRAEPLDEENGPCDSGEGGTRVRVLRPSYQRPRARRKL